VRYADVGIRRQLACDNDERDSNNQFRRCGGTAGAAELETQIAMGAFVNLSVGAVEVRPVNRHREQQRGYRQEGD
jgi:hypothetical protein